jgi:glycosyltransferase involved in cell wall biosynthesis
VSPKVSLIIPVYNEEESLGRLFEALEAVGPSLPQPYEVVLVDDGSIDKSFAILKEASTSRPWMRVVRFRRNYGQTAALAAGIDHSRAPVIVALDADLQNDPKDIPEMLKKLDEGYDVVSGWRKKRQDKAFTRKLPSSIANWVIGRVSGLKLHDYGCTLKAYRRFVLEPYTLYGEMHRFIPIYASWHGARVTELVVNHRVRQAGVSKYGLSRTGKVILDLLVVKFLVSYTTKPIYLFGGFGLLSLLTAFVAFVAAVGYKLFAAKDFVQTPLPLLGVLFALVGILSLLMGLLAELLVRTYYESQGKRPYSIAEELNRPESRRGSLD